MNKEEFAEKFGRWIENDEIVFDADNREKGFETINFIGIKLYEAGYKFEIYYAKGQKSPHLHVKEIRYLDLEGEKLQKYKKLFLIKYTPREYSEFLDLQLAGKHRIAEENKFHYKYKTIKKLLNTWNEDKENYVELELIERAKQTEKRKRSFNKEVLGITSKIAEKISIIDIALKYGIKVRGKMALCPFHADKNPSLSFDDNRGLFNCFGCNTKGNIIDFIYLLRKNKIAQIENA